MGWSQGEESSSQTHTTIQEMENWKEQTQLSDFPKGHDIGNLRPTERLVEFSKLFFVDFMPTVGMRVFVTLENCHLNLGHG